jgi:hypothetical protein
MNAQSSSVKPRYAGIATLTLVVACAVLLWVNHGLQKQNRLMDEQLRSLSTGQGPPVGSKISFLRGHTVSGQPATLDLSQRENRTLLLVLSPQCKYTKLNFSHWRDLLSRVPLDQIIYVDLTDTADFDYLASVAVPSNANLIRLDPEERTLYSLSVTPTTVLLGPHGVVRFVWPGVMGQEQSDQLWRLLKSPTG